MHRLTVLAMFAALVFAQEEKKEEKADPKPAPKVKPVELDELSKKILEAWDKKAYSMSRAGVKKASCTMKATLDDGGMEMKGSAPYKWDGEKGTLEWDNAQLGATLAQRGWSVGQVQAGKFVGIHAAHIHPAPLGCCPDLVKRPAGLAILDPDGLDLTVRAAQNLADHAATPEPLAHARLDPRARSMRSATPATAGSRARRAPVSSNGINCFSSGPESRPLIASRSG